MRTLVLGSVLLTACLSPASAYAYDDATTHPALTDAIIDYYNATHPTSSRIDDVAREAMVAGSRNEDTPPRWINHLYDPVHQTGWTGEHTGMVPAAVVRAVSVLALAQHTPLAAPTWAISEVAQTAYAAYGGVHTWQRAITSWRAGDTHAAYTTLGHILHLLEDMGVPEHTRNDTHAHQVAFITGDTGSPLETYARRYDRGAFQAKAYALAAAQKEVRATTTPARNLAALFEIVARYSNERFFSKDTINAPEYALPTIVEEVDGTAYGRDEEGRRLALARRVNVISDDGSITTTLALADGAGFEAVLEGYVDHLASMVIVRGAELIDLFKSDAADSVHASNPLTRLVPHIWSPVGAAVQLRDALVRVAGATRRLINNVRARVIDGDGANAPTVTLSPMVDDALVPQTVPPPEVPTSVPVKKKATKKKKAATKVTSTTTTRAPHMPSTITTTTRTTPPKTSPEKASSTRQVVEQVAAPCTYQSGMQNVPMNEVRLNEIAWMGTEAAATHEWIEIHNGRPETVDLYGWQLVSATGGVQIRITKHLRVGEGGYALFERTSDASVPGVMADLVYSGGLRNTDEALTLFDPHCRVVDGTAVSAVATPTWPGGDAGTHQTMERVSNGTGWQTSEQAGGTPAAPNSRGRVAAVAAVSHASPPPVVSTTSAVAVVIPTSTTMSSSVVQGTERILISEIQVAGVDAGDEFVELYNPSNYNVPIGDWSLQYLTGTGTTTGSIAKRNFEASTTIAAHHFFLVARGVDSSGSDGYRGTTTPDLVQRSIALSGTGGRIALVRSHTAITSTIASDVVDLVDYRGRAPQPRSSLERRARVDGVCVVASERYEDAGNDCDEVSGWDERPVPRPQNSGSQPEPIEHTTPTTTEASPYFDEVGLYQGEDQAGSSYLLALHAREPWWSTQQDTSADQTPRWILIVPYRTNEIDAVEPPRELSTDTNLIPPHETGFRFEYPTCAGGVAISAVILIPQNNAACQTGGLLSNAYAGDALEDQRILVRTQPTMLDGQLGSVRDRIRIATYRFGGGRAGTQYFDLVSISSSTPVHDGRPDTQPPHPPTGLTITVDAARQQARFTWEAARDDDSLDALLTYEASCNPGAQAGGVWSSVGQERAVTFAVAPGEQEACAVRAIDPQQNVSVEAMVSIIVRADLPQLTAQLDHEVLVAHGSAVTTLAVATAVRAQGVALWLGADQGPYCCGRVRARLYLQNAFVGSTIVVGPRTVDEPRRYEAVFTEPVAIIAGEYEVRIVADEEQPSNQALVYGNAQGEPYVQLITAPL